MTRSFRKLPFVIPSFFICFLLLSLEPSAVLGGQYDIQVDFAFDTTADPEKQVIGYRLYQEGTPACDSNSYDLQSMTCLITSDAGTFNFTMSARYSDQTESPQSAPFPFTITEDALIIPLVAELSVSSEQGEIPFSTTFSSTGSTGTITGYSWNFGDGTTATGPTAEHTYQTPGIYTATLTIYNPEGDSSQSSTVITVTQPIVPDPPPAPPIAVISSSTASGEAPLMVQFDASGSSATDNPIISYAWDFGDGSASEGSQVSHNYTEPGTYQATLTVTDQIGLSSQASKTIAINPPPAPPTAVISSSSTAGEAPLEVQFDGSGSAATDHPIVSYSWNFGDGSTAAGSRVSHSYSEPGTYQATLTVTDEIGLTAQATKTIVVSPPPVPPTAVISSSSTAGEAPLEVQFDGSGSAATDHPIVSYSWNFGDGSTAAGSRVSHSYSEPGTYHASLTVTDQIGLTGGASTPIVISAPPPPENEPPVAVMTLSEPQGKAPLLVTFSAAESSDPDGTITEYVWNFGDGSSATGITAEHSYAEAADYTVTLQISDDAGETASASTIITVLAADEALFLYELGEVEIDHEWLQVAFTQQFTNPAVICGPPTLNDTDPVTVRVRNVTQDGFEVRIQEWDYLDGTHNPEIISFFAMEQGSYTLPDGTMIEAGTFTGTSSYQNYALQQPQESPPVILTQVISENELDAVTGRVRKVGSSQFQYMLQEQESTKNAHIPETVTYIAWQPGSGMLSSELYYETAATPDSITHDWFGLEFQKQFTEPPLFLADMQSCDGGEPSIIRAQNITSSSVQINIEEEQSKDSEVKHTTETAGYIVFGFPSN